MNKLIDSSKKCYNKFDLCVCKDSNIIIHMKTHNWVCYNCCNFGFLKMKKECHNLTCECEYHIINSDLYFIQQYLLDYKKFVEENKRREIMEWFRNNDIDD